MFYELKMIDGSLCDVPVVDIPARQLLGSFWRRSWQDRQRLLGGC